MKFLNLNAEFNVKFKNIYNFFFVTLKFMFDLKNLIPPIIYTFACVKVHPYLLF